MTWAGLGATAVGAEGELALVPGRGGVTGAAAARGDGAVRAELEAGIEAFAVEQAESPTTHAVAIVRTTTSQMNGRLGFLWTTLSPSRFSLLL